VNRPTTAREALVAELIGDVATLLERMESVRPAVDEATQALVEAAGRVAGSVEPFQARITGVAKQAQVLAEEHISVRAQQLAPAMMVEQSAAMTQAAQSIVREQVEPTLQRLTASLERVVKRADRPWDTWLMQAATAAVSAGGSAVLVLSLLGRW
jgi:uncharacterized protein (DUF885 family)